MLWQGGRRTLSQIPGPLRNGRPGLIRTISGIVRRLVTINIVQYHTYQLRRPAIHMKVTSTGGRGLWVAADFLFLVFGTSRGLSAQSLTPPAEPLRLSLDAAVHAALTNNTSIQLARRRFRVSSPCATRRSVAELRGNCGIYEPDRKPGFRLVCRSTVLPFRAEWDRSGHQTCRFKFPSRCSTWR